MMQAVFKVAVPDHKEKQKVLKTIAGLAGVDSVSIDTKDKKLKVVGDIDPVSIGSKLKKLCHTELLSAGPAKETQQKDGEGKKKPQRKDGEGKKKHQRKDVEGKKKPKRRMMVRGKKKDDGQGEKLGAEDLIVLFAKLWGFLRRIKKENK